MFTIGDFARHGRVSVRMLRHYDAIGLLPPARVDPVTGYRSYGAEQLARLNRIIALKDLGFSLQQVGAILDERIGAEELRGMLRLRRTELAAAMAADARRLAGVEARLRTIESEGNMPADDIVVKSVPAARVAVLRATAPGDSPQDIGPVVGPLYPRLFHLLEEAGIAPAGHAIGYYEEGEGGDVLLCHVAVPVNAEPREDLPFDIVDLPAVENAATLIHRGPMDDLLPSLQTLARWIDAHGYRSTGYARELYLETPLDDHSLWVTELQEPIEPAR